MTLHSQKTPAHTHCLHSIWILKHEWISASSWRPACVRTRRTWGRVMSQPCVWFKEQVEKPHADTSGFCHSLAHEQDNKIMNDQLRCATHCQRHTPCSHKAISWQVISGLKNWFHFQPGPEVTTDNTVKMWFLDWQIKETEEGFQFLVCWCPCHTLHAPWCINATSSTHPQQV